MIYLLYITSVLYFLNRRSLYTFNWYDSVFTEVTEIIFVYNLIKLIKTTGVLAKCTLPYPAVTILISYILSCKKK